MPKVHEPPKSKKPSRTLPDISASDALREATAVGDVADKITRAPKAKNKS